MTTFNENHQLDYCKKGLDKIVPLEVAIKAFEAVNGEGCDCDVLIKEVIYNSENFSKRRSYKGVGNRIGGSYRFCLGKTQKRFNKNAFGRFILLKEAGRTDVEQNGTGLMYLWDEEKKERIWLSSFEAYVLISEYKNAYFNSHHLNLDGSMNPEPFNKPIGYYQFYKKMGKVGKSYKNK